MLFYQIVQVSAVLLTGLVAGLFYAFQCSVIKGLGRLEDKVYLSSFRSINKVILNPWFFASFMGCLPTLPLASWLSYNAGEQTSLYLLALATGAYFFGVFGVTVLLNVPLNEALARFNVNTATEKELLSQRKLFESSWNTYNLIRTIAAISSFLLTILSLLQH